MRNWEKKHPRYHVYTFITNILVGSICVSYFFLWPIWVKELEYILLLQQMIWASASDQFGSQFDKILFIFMFRFFFASIMHSRKCSTTVIRKNVNLHLIPKNVTKQSSFFKDFHHFVDHLISFNCQFACTTKSILFTKHINKFFILAGITKFAMCNWLYWIINYIEKRLNGCMPAKGQKVAKIRFHSVLIDFNCTKHVDCSQRFENLYSFHMFVVTYFPLRLIFDSSNKMCSQIALWHYPWDYW